MSYCPLRWTVGLRTEVPQVGGVFCTGWISGNEEIRVLILVYRLFNLCWAVFTNKWVWLRPQTPPPWWRHDRGCLWAAPLAGRTRAGLAGWIWRCNSSGSLRIGIVFAGLRQVTLAGLASGACTHSLGTPRGLQWRPGIYCTPASAAPSCRIPITRRSAPCPTMVSPTTSYTYSLFSRWSPVDGSALSGVVVEGSLGPGGLIEVWRAEGR